MIATLSEIRLADADLVGGKAANCARLRQAGFPVPDGLVVSVDLTGADFTGNGNTDGAAADTGRRLLTHPWLAAFPSEQRFAVRSSAVGEDSAGHSFAGVHETTLNVERSELAGAVLACVRSTTSEQARAYRASRGLPPPARTGVLIQPMVAARASGVVFTVNPVTGDEELVAEAIAGLGDDLVSGRVQPDRLRIRKPDGAVIEEALVGSRPVLTTELRGALVALAARVEAHYGAAQDIEWAADAETLWLLQSRPITTAPSPASTPGDPIPPPLVDLPSARPDVEWTRANLAEVMPDQMSPQGLVFCLELMNASQRRFAGGLLASEERHGPPFGVIGGRMYFNLTQLTHMSRLGGAPPAAAKRSLGHADGISPQDEIHSPVPFWTLIPLVPDVARLLWLDIRSEAIVRALDADNAAASARLSVPEPAALDDAALWQRLTEWAHDGPRRMVVVLALGGVVMLEEQLRRICRSVGEDYDALVYPQLAVGEPSVSTQQALDLIDLVEIARSEPKAAAYLTSRPPDAIMYRQDLPGSRFGAAFDRFLERYGHRGLYETDYALPRFREDPSPLLFAIQTHLRNPSGEPRSVVRARLEREAAEAWARFDAKLSWFQRLTLRPRVKTLLTRIKTRYVRREYCRSELIKVMEYARRLHLLLAARFVERGWIDRVDDYFLLLTAEIDARVQGALAPEALRPIIESRRRRLAFERTLSMPLYLRQADIPAVLAGTAPATADSGALRSPVGVPAPAASDGEERLRGTCVSRGAVEAPVVVIRDPREFALMQPGAILVAPATDPSWTPLFTLAVGVIVEIGGVLSHASTVAREYGLPALANVKNATTRLRTGERVRLDASAGFVQRLPHDAAG